jgi:hypothetical protein
MDREPGRWSKWGAYDCFDLGTKQPVALNRLMNGARRICRVNKNIAKKHDDLMASAVIDKRDKILCNDSAVQDQLRKTLGCGSRLLVRGLDMGLDTDMIKGLSIPKV